MPVLAFTGAETGSTLELTTPSGVSMETAVVRSGKYAYRFSATGIGTLLYPATTETIYFRGYLQVSALPTAVSTCVDFRSGAGVVQANLRVNTTGILQLAGGAITPTNGTIPLIIGVYYRVEMLLSQATGYVEVRLNGRREIAGTFSLPTSIAQTALQWGVGPGSVYWDDVHLTTDGWPGPGYVIARQGKSTPAPTYNDFSKSSGTDIAALLSDTPFNIASFALSTAVSQTQTMCVEAPSQLTRGGKYGYPGIHAVDILLACRVAMVAKRVASGPDLYISRVVGGSLTHELVGVPSADTFLQSSCWLPATLRQLDACEIGGHRGAGTANLQIEDAWLMISVAEMPHGVQHFTGNETGALQECGPVTGTVSSATDIVRSGSYAMKLTGGLSQLTLTPVLPTMTIGRWDLPVLFLRVYIYLPILITETILRLYSSGQNVASIGITASGNALLIVNGVTQGTLVGVILAGEHIRVEVMHKSAALGSDGQVILRINGQDFAFTGITGGAITMVLAEVATASNVLYLDDVLFDDRQWPGPGRILARQGIAGTPTDAVGWGITGGATIQEVWSNTPVNAASRCQALAINTGQTMPVAPISANGVNGDNGHVGDTDVIVACRIAAYATLVSGSGPGAMHALRRRFSGSVVDVPVSLPDTSARLHYSDIFQAIPERLDAMEIGGFQTTPLVPAMLIQDLWLMVAYAELELVELPLPTTPQVAALARITAQLDGISPVVKAILRTR